MKKNYIAKAVVSAGLAVSAGVLLGIDSVRAQGSEELLSFSRQNFGIATARSAGMGGAFTSLGADAVSLSLNPAGIAMYKSSEVSISPGLRIGGRTADYSGAGGSITNRENMTKANIGSGAVVYAGKNFAVGFGMNRLADFNGRSHAVGYGEQFSIGDMFAAQLYGIPVGDIAAPQGNEYQAFERFRNFPSLWGGIMGYQTGLVDPAGGTNPQAYTTNGIINPGATLFPDVYRRTTGAINEYALSGGYSLNDVLYIGATLGIQDIYYNRYDTYAEIAPADNVGLDQLTYNQNLRMSGTGVNLKIGATVRPLPWLRVGLAYHSPTWINMSEEYDADMTVWDFRYDLPAYSDTPILRNEYNMRTPSRLMAGVSATLGTFGIISVDYERTWYQNMKYSTDGFQDVNEYVKGMYAPSNIIRAGVEFQPIKSLFLRAGYGYSSSVYQNSDFKKWGEYQQFSGGIGFRSRVVSVDLAYVYGKTHQSPYKPYYYDEPERDDANGYYPARTITTDGTVYTKEQNHNVILTLAFKF